MSSSAFSTVYRAAVKAVRYGINTLPILGDGTKRPPMKWKYYQYERVNLRDLQRWFLSTGYPGMAFVTGAISRNLEVLDFDTREVYQSWREQMHARGLDALAERLAQGYLEASPEGIHLLYRCPTIEGNQKLAGCLVGSEKKQATLIETRGEGGLVVVAPSSGGVHRSGKPYQVLKGGPATIQTLTASEREMILQAARSLDELPPPPQPRQHRPPCTPMRRVDRCCDEGELPGHIFNRQASWEEVLLPHGWRLLDVRDGEGYWTKHIDVHATTNYRGSDLFYVFSTSTVFEPRVGYSKFAAYTLLNFGSLNKASFAAAARSLAQLGYTSR